LPRLIWTAEALADIQRLYRFLTVKDPGAAQRAVQAIRQQTRILAAQPHLGRPADGMAEPFREWLVDFGNSGYAVRYRISDDAIVMLAVRHFRKAGYL
jgi:plasmid stabilization system protein ParE